VTLRRIEPVNFGPPPINIDLKIEKRSGSLAEDYQTTA
jgi:hypothetical protein